MNKTSSLVRKRYDRLASFLDFIESLGGSRLRQWRTLLWSKVEGRNILEVGVGTGANFPFYPAGARVTAIDFSANMLKRAREKAKRMDRQVLLEEMDIQSLRYPDDTFDTVVASLVFCSVPDPARGLQEVKRVCKPGSRVVLLEHVVSSRAPLRFLMDLFNPIILWTLGDNINRRTVEAVAASGLRVERVTHLGGIFRLIEARKADGRLVLNPE